MSDVLAKEPLTEPEQITESLAESTGFQVFCREFENDNREGFDAVTKILLGIQNSEEVFRSQFLLNNVCSIYSTISTEHLSFPPASALHSS